VIKCSYLLKSSKGKIIGIDLILEDNRIADIVIFGDFFAYPPEIIDELQNSLRNCRLDEVRDIVYRVCWKGKLVGIDANDIVNVIFKAIEEC